MATCMSEAIDPVKIIKQDWEELKARFEEFELLFTSLTAEPEPEDTPDPIIVGSFGTLSIHKECTLLKFHIKTDQGEWAWDHENNVVTERVPQSDPAVIDHLLNEFIEEAVRMQDPFQLSISSLLDVKRKFMERFNRE